MRDPDLVLRAQVAASALEGAWRRWRTVHGRIASPTPAVSSYVGYSPHEPWGQPRVVFGIAAEDAEQLAALIERPDGVKPAYATAPTKPGARDLAALPGTQALSLPLPRYAPAMAQLGQPLGDLLLASDDSGYDEPVYRQAAAAMKEAAAARENATRAKPDAAEAADEPLLSPERIGSLTRAASTARAEAEARIRAAALTGQDDDEPEVDQPDAAEPAAAGLGAAGLGAAGPDAAEPAAAGLGAAGISAGDPGAGGLVAGGLVAGGPGAGELRAGELGAGEPSDGVATAEVHDAEAIDAGFDDVQDEDGQPELDDEQDAAADDEAAAGDDPAAALPRIYATDVLEPLPSPEVAAEPPVADAGELDQDEAVAGRDTADQDADEDAPDQNDHEIAASAPSDGPGAGNARKARPARSRPIARRSRSKRSGSPSQASGS